MIRLLLTMFLVLCSAVCFGQEVPSPEKFDFVKLLLSYREIIGGIVMAFSGLLVVALLIPGDQPDKFLQSAIDFLKKFSSK